MKTAEDLAPEIKHGLMWNQHVFKAETGKDYLTSVIKQIQLDAMKEGMRRAASEESLNIGDGEDYVRVQAILTAAENLTLGNL